VNEPAAYSRHSSTTTDAIAVIFLYVIVSKKPARSINGNKIITELKRTLNKKNQKFGAELSVKAARCRMPFYGVDLGFEILLLITLSAHVVRTCLDARIVTRHKQHEI